MCDTESLATSLGSHVYKFSVAFLALFCLVFGVVGGALPYFTFAVSWGMSWCLTGLWYLGKVMGLLFLLQFVVQLLMVVVFYLTSNLRHILLVWGIAILGLPPNRHEGDVDHKLSGMSLPWLSLFLVEYISGHTVFFGLILATTVTLVLNFCKVFIVFKTYRTGRGAGINIYYDHCRVLGIDWHRWLVKQQGKHFLSKKDQYYINRPHLDFPQWGMYHWPWDTIKKSPRKKTQRNPVPPREKVSEVGMGDSDADTNPIQILETNTLIHNEK